MSDPAFDIHQLQDMDYVEEKWQQWSDENKSTKFDAVSEEELKENIIKDLSFVSQMSVQEYTLIRSGKKYTENIQQKSHY